MRERQPNLRLVLLDVTGANAAGYGAAGKRRFDERFTYAHFRDRFCDEIRRLTS